MDCPGCGRNNPDGKRFCGECGAPLPVRCAACGAENPGGAKFCGDCGAALTATGPTPAAPARSATRDVQARAERRQLTVMFCDLVGFTTICEHMAPAQAAALLNTFLTRMTDVVFEHEGTLDKFLGDALLAVFGAPFDQPRHAQRAVEAALAMRRSLDELNRANDGGPQLQMRIAINSGIALTGDIGSPRRREFTVLGDVVNTAARIEELTSPGAIMISGATVLPVFLPASMAASKIARACISVISG